MIWIEHFNDAAGWLAWLASANVQAAVLIGIVLAMRAAMGRWLTPGWRGALWLLIALRLLVPMAIESRYSLAALGRQIAALRTTPPVTIAPTPQPAKPADIAPSVSVTYGPIPGVAAPAPTAVVSQPAPPYAKVAVAVWLGVAALLLLRQLLSTIVLRRATRRMRTIDDAGTLALLARCATDVGVRQRVRIVETERLRAPAVCGILHPIILLPAGATQSFTPADLRLMLMHELVHVRRDDVIVSALFRFIAALHWFNPFVWIAAATFRVDRELACDAAVLRLLNDADRHAYGECVLRVVEHVSTLRPHPATLGVFGSTRHLRQRIDMIAHAGTVRWRVGPTVVGMAACVAIGAAVAVGDPVATSNPHVPASRTAAQPARPASTEADDAAAAEFFAARIEEPKIFANTPFAAMLGQIEVAAAVPIRVDWAAVEGTGVARTVPVTTSFKNVSLGKALSILCASAGNPGRPLDFEFDGDAVLISSREAIANQFARTRKFPLGRLFLGVVDGGKVNRAGEHLLRTLTSMNDRETWLMNGGTVGTIEFADDQLVVRHTPRRLGVIAKTLGGLSGIGDLVALTKPTTKPADPARAQATVDGALGVELRPTATPFEAVVEQLRQQSTSPIFVNWTAVTGAGVKRDVPITFTLPGDVTFGKALSITLDAAGGGAVKLGFSVDDGVITISTREDLTKNVATRTYDIRDLLVVIPDGDPRSATQPAQVSREALVAQIVDTIQSTIEPDDWKKNGGLIGAIQELGGQLIVTNTPRAQQSVVELLRQFREGRAIQVNVEARFLLIDIDKLPAAFDRLMKATKKDSPLGETFFLDDLGLSEWQKAIAIDPNVKTLAAPRLTLFNGQQAFVKVATPLEYIKSYSLTKTAAGERRYEPVMESTMTTGCSAMVQTTVSADRKYVTISVHPTMTTLLKMENVPFPTAEEGKSELAIQRPILDVQELQTTVSVPDRGTLLMTAGGVGGANGKQLLVMLFKPTVIIQREVEQEAFPLLEAN